jgi:hypothetical protein
MGALNTHWSTPQAVVLAVIAGADLVIGPYNTVTVIWPKTPFGRRSTLAS